MTTRNKTTHSPLPWLVGHPDCYIEDANGMAVARVVSSTTENEKEKISANVALIVEAVNAYGLLQSALSFALNSLEEITDPHVGYFITGPMHERAKEAMKCARAALGREADDGQE